MVVQVQPGRVRKEKQADIEYHDPELGQNSFGKGKITCCITCQDTFDGAWAEVEKYKDNGQEQQDDRRQSFFSQPVGMKVLEEVPLITKNKKRQGGCGFLGAEGQKSGKQ